MANGGILEQYESNVRSYCRSFDRIFSRAKQHLLFDVEGNEYIDFLMGAGTLNYGHNPDCLRAALLDYLSKDGLAHSLDLYTEAKQQFVASLVTRVLQPRGLDYIVQFTNPTGTSSIESAIKLAKKITNRKNIVAFTRGFHGVSGGSLGLTASAHFKTPYSSLDSVIRMPYFNSLGPEVDEFVYLEGMLSMAGSGLDKPAAVILETVQGEGGINVASAEWLQKVRALTQQLDILLIIDDIQAGCGRTGKFFSFEHSGIKPDIICLSKSISGYGLPLSINLFPKYLDKWDVGEDIGTFRGFCLAMVTGKAAIDEFWTTDEIEKGVVLRERILGEALQNLKLELPDLIVDVRGRGLFWGLEFFDPEYAYEVAQNCLREGLIVERCGPTDSVVKFLPALNIDVEALRKGIEIFKNAVTSLHVVEKSEIRA